MTGDADDLDPAHARRNWRLLLSGGSHRAALGGGGAILYLAQGKTPGHTKDVYWDRVSEIISVSGGSILNSALLARSKSDAAPDVALAIQSFVDEMLRDRLKFYKSARRLLATLLIAGSVFGTMYAMLVGFGVLTDPVDMSSTVAFLVGFSTAWLAVRIVTWSAGYYTEDAIGQIGPGNKPAPLSDYHGRAKQHVICATGLGSMHPYYFWGGGSDFFAGGDLDNPAPRPPDTVWGNPVQGKFNTRHATYASSSLPMLARLKTNSERLIDGGASGTFGLQVSEGTRSGSDGTGLATASGTSDDWPFIIAIDAGVEPGGPSFWANAAGKLFTMVRLSQWIKAENNALYEKEAKELIAREAKVLTIARDGTTSGDGLVDVRLTQLRTRNKALKFYKFSESQLLDAVLAGFVGMYVVISTRFDDKAVGNQDVEDQLQLLADRVPRLGGQLSARWQSLDSSVTVTASS